MSNEISLSVEETNKLRISLGLKPIELEPVKKLELVVIDKPVEVDMKSSHVVEPEVNIFDDAKLDDTDDWLKNLANKAKTKEMVPTEPVVELDEDVSADIKIGHSLEELTDLKEGTVFVLKDKSILDDEDDDELVAEDIIQKQDLKEDLKNKYAKDKRKFKGYYGDEDEVANTEAKEEISLHNKKRLVFSDDEDTLELKTDYQDAKPVKMKKLKKKMGNHRSKPIDESERKLEYVPLTKDDDEDDDDELQSILAALRRKNIQKKRRLNPEEFVTRVESEVKSESAGGLVVDELSEFLSAIKKEDIKQEENEEERIPEPVKEVEQVKAEVKEEVDAVQIPETVEEPLKPIEEDVSTGLGSTLKLLQKRAILNKQDSQSKEIKQTQRELLRQRELIEFERQKLSKTDVELLRRLDWQEQELLRNYNPTVNIKYHDANGTALTTKEAYKQMSHQFHGKAPSNNKSTKRKS